MKDIETSTALISMWLHEKFMPVLAYREVERT